MDTLTLEALLKNLRHCSQQWRSRLESMGFFSDDLLKELLRLHFDEKKKGRIFFFVQPSKRKTGLLP